MAGRAPVPESDPRSPRSEKGFSASLPQNMQLLNLNDTESQQQQEMENGGEEHEDLSSTEMATSTTTLYSISQPEALCGTPPPDHAPIQADEPNDEGVAIRHKHMREKVELHSGDGMSVQDLSEFESSWGSISSITHCHKCEIYRTGFPSTESNDFWKSIDNKPDCHTKYFKAFIDKLKERFQADGDLLKDRKMINVLRHLLHVPESDVAAVVNLGDYVRLVRFFGPVCEDKDQRCILLSQLKIIIEKSLKKDSHTRETVSWFAGDINRPTAESFLNDKEEGTYLVRMTQSSAENGSFAVSVKHENNIHHFEIEGNPDEAVESHKSDPFTYSAKLEWKDQNYNNLPEVIAAICDGYLSTEDEPDLVIYCRKVCPGLPLNAQICGYKKTRRH